MYICSISPVMTDVQGGWMLLWLTATFFSQDVNAKLGSLLHSRQLEKLDCAASSEEKRKRSPLNVRIPTSNTGAIQQPKASYVRSHRKPTISYGHFNLLKAHSIKYTGHLFALRRI